MKIAYKFSYAFLIVLFLVLTCLKRFKICKDSTILVIRNCSKRTASAAFVSIRTTTCERCVCRSCCAVTTGQNRSLKWNKLIIIALNF